MNYNKRMLINNPFGFPIELNLELIFAGTAFGSCSLKNPEGKLRAKQLVGSDNLRFYRVTKPRIGFTNVVGHASEYRMNDDLNYLVEGIPECDAIFFEEFRFENSHLVFIPNADCPVVTLFALASNGNYCFVVCHVGLKTLAHEKTILDNAYASIVAHLGEDFTLQVVAGLGARNCCYGLDWERSENKILYNQLSERFSLEHGTVKWGPRKGQPAVDMERLIVENVEELHPYAAITTLGFCTSCHGMINKDVVGYGNFFSNLRDEHQRGGRNGCLVKLSCK